MGKERKQGAKPAKRAKPAKPAKQAGKQKKHSNQSAKPAKSRASRRSRRSKASKEQSEQRAEEAEKQKAKFEFKFRTLIFRKYQRMCPRYASLGLDCGINTKRKMSLGLDFIHPKGAPVHGLKTRPDSVLPGFAHRSKLDREDETHLVSRYISYSHLMHCKGNLL